MSENFADERAVMLRAIELAARGVGRVEPNPPVGAVIVDESLRLVGEGYHEIFGGPHAEINALKQATSDVAGATLFVTLEPCCHHGKTGPCTAAVIGAGIRRVVVGILDPSPHASGQGVAALRAAGLQVEDGFQQDAVRRLTAPFLKLVETGLPYVHAKWAMTLDGKIASRTGSSQWISSARSREKVHELRGRMDAIVVGAGTAKRDDPLLTPRPPGPRTPVRIVLNRQADIPVDSQLLQSAESSPVLIAAGRSAPQENVQRLSECGLEVLTLADGAASGDDSDSLDAQLDLHTLIAELGRRRMSNVLVEGGGRLLGSLFDERLVDYVHVFLAPKLIGGSQSVTPLGGAGIGEMSQAATLDDPVVQAFGEDVYMHGAVQYCATGAP